MSFVTTLISSRSAPAITRRAEDLASALRGCLSVLSPGLAYDIVTEEAPERARLVSSLEGILVDVVVQPCSNRRKRILLADMDSTMIEQECIDELADVAGVGAEVAGVTARAMNGEIEFDDALRRRVATLAGRPVSDIERVIKERITFAPGARTTVQTMRAHGAHCLLVSGGFTAFTRHVGDRLGFHEHRANTLETADDRLTGFVREPILGRQAKVDALDDACARLELNRADAVCVGDGANDLGMLAAAGTGIAIHAKPAVAAAAPHRIDHGDLTALLYLQGYRDEDFVS